MSSIAWHFVYGNKNGDIIGFGNNNYGQLANEEDPTIINPRIIHNNPNVVAIRLGREYTFLIQDDGKCFGTGANYTGLLGVGDKLEKYQFTQTKLNKKVVDIACGWEHTMFLTDEGEVFYCGGNDEGQLGVRVNDRVDVPTLLTTNVKQIGCGARFTILYKKNGDLLVFGRNYYGELGIKNVSSGYGDIQLLMMTNDISYVHCGGVHTLIQYKNGDLYTYGWNEYGQTGHGREERTIPEPKFLMNLENPRYFSLGAYQTSILKFNGELIAFGSGDCGEFGHKKYESIHRPSVILRDHNIKYIFSGNKHSIRYKRNGDLLACGDNSYNQLGLDNNNISSVNDPVKVCNDPTLTIFPNLKILGWSCDTHEVYPISFKKEVLSFLFCLKRLQKNSGIRIPKFVVHEIIKLLDN